MYKLNGLYCMGGCTCTCIGTCTGGAEDRRIGSCSGKLPFCFKLPFKVICRVYQWSPTLSDTTEIGDPQCPTAKLDTEYNAVPNCLHVRSSVVLVVYLPVFLIYVGAVP